MKTVDVSKFTVVKAGVPCQSETPIRLERLLALMERNEEYIFWLQPAAGGIDDQFPCVSINGKYYMLNLKLEKAIFRHVRLCRDFQNSELLEDGTRKLRIPQRLLNEKLKTSCRFQSMAPTSGTRKLKRLTHRGGKKENTIDSAKQMRLRQFHASVQTVLANTSKVVALASTPDDCVQLLQRIFRAEFPNEPGQLCIRMLPE